MVRQVAGQVRPPGPDAELVPAGDAAAAVWVISAAFVRFAEDNGLLARPAPPEPADSATSWLLARFDAFAAADPARELFNRWMNPVYQIEISEEAARHLVTLWERDDQGRPIDDFTSPALDTRIFGDLYEHLAGDDRERYALVRTPQFVVDFILDRTLTPAIEASGSARVRLVDPVCGSGGFLIGAFARLLDAWAAAAPAMPVEERIGHASRAVHGVDLHPLAVLVCRFRLLMAAVRAGGARTLDAVPGGSWQFHIAAGDSLLDDCRLAGDYDVVVGNPPYTTVRDKNRDQRYRDRYDACLGRYALTVPFAQRFFESARPDGYVGQLTANSFMKREFGRKLAVEVLAQRVTLTHLIDTSGAFIPGHGVPTGILIGRNRPADDTEPVFTIVGTRGEPAVPADPACGLVWQSILRHSTIAGQADTWTESRYLDRAQLRSFPWRMTTGEAEIVLDEIGAAPYRLHEFVGRIGYAASTGADDIFAAPRASFTRFGIPRDELVVDVLTGSEVRDWIAVPERCAFFPYPRARHCGSLAELPGHHRRLWPYRTVLGRRPTSARPYHATEWRSWYDWHQLSSMLNTQPCAIVYSWVATHNHFAPLRDGAVPLPSAPMIKLPPDAPPHRRTDLLALLSSSTVACWLRHGSQSKGKPDAAQTGSGERWDDFFEITATRLRDLPMPALRHTPNAAELEDLARELTATTPAAVLATYSPSRARLADARARWEHTRARMLALQEELDWEVYLRYGLLADPTLVAPPKSVPPISFGERAFEMVLGRQIEAGETQTEWFTRHGGVPVTRLPAHWPAAYADVVDRRIDAIRRDRRLAALEKPEFKRRWATDGWDAMQTRALRDWLLDQLEAPELWGAAPRPLSVAQLADQIRDNDAFRAGLDLWVGHDRHDPVKTLAALLADEHVPYLAALRYREAGLAKRATWEEVWRRQRHEDALRTDGDTRAADALRDRIPDPPRYTSADFRRPSYWRQRGKYDVQNERFISYPPPTGPTTDLLIGWAGWTSAERAQVLVDLIMAAPPGSQTVVPLLAGLREVLPWVDLWSPEANDRYRAFFDTRLRQLDLTEPQLADWRPPPPRRGRPRKVT